MTEMVFGTTPVRAGDPILPRWWRTLDKWSLACVLGLFSIGILLGVLVIFAAWILTGIYIVWANGTYDRALHQYRDRK